MRQRGNKPRGVTAEELMAELEADSRYVARRQEREKDRRAKESEWRSAEAPLVEELRNAGFKVDSAWDLVNTDAPYPKAIPILLEHLQRPYPDRVREGIARALAVRDATFGWDLLMCLYRQEPSGTDAKDGLAVAIAGAADDMRLDDVITLARDAQHGSSRLLLLRALERSRSGRARAALETLAADPELADEVRRIVEA
jgi:hypothetical protein